MTIADEIWDPAIIKDNFWKTPAEPMYSVDARNERYNPQVGSVSNLKLVSFLKNFGMLR